jgi:hypothetical protein
MTHVTDHAAIERLQAEITAQQRLLDGIDQALGSLYEGRKHGVERLFELQAQLANHARDHYSALLIEAQAAAKDQSQGRAEDFRGGDAA